MKYLFSLLLFSSPFVHAQLTFEVAETAMKDLNLYTYSYFEKFHGLAGYVNGCILTNDGGAAGFASYADENMSGALLLKLDKTGKESWRSLVAHQGEEMETQGVVQDKAGNYFALMLVYDSEKYRGGRERIVCFDNSGKQLWDKTFGEFSVVNNPIFSYARMLEDGRIELRGHIVVKEPAEDQDPEYHYWEAWIDSKGDMTEKTGQLINWETDNWQQWYMPE